MYLCENESCVQVILFQVPKICVRARVACEKGECAQCGYALEYCIGIIQELLLIEGDLINNVKTNKEVVQVSDGGSFFPISK